MNPDRKLWRAALALVVIVAAGLPLDDQSAAFAQESNQKRETRKTPAMREKVYTKLTEAQAAAEANNQAEALKILSGLEHMRDLNSYEVAQMHSFYGFIYYSQENYTKALQSYEKVLQQPELPIAMENATIYTVAQLYFVQDNYAKAVEYLNRWFKIAENPGPAPYVLLSQALYQLERYRDAIPPLEQAMSIAREQGKEIQENWWLLLRTYYYELENYPKVTEILQILLRQWPKRDYLVQLAAMYGQAGDEGKQLAAYEAAYLQGWLTRGSDIVLLSQLYMQADVPFSAARVLKKGFADGLIEKTASNYRLYSQSWTLAQNDREAIEPLKQAAALTSDGELDVRLAQSYMNLRQWDDAAAAAEDALRKGVDGRAEVQLLLGMTRYNQKRYGAAQTAFREAVNDNKVGREARQWLTYVEKEQERQRQLKGAL